MTSYIQKFNPQGLPEETLGAIATGRERVLEDILSIIARNAEGGRVQHLQVVAPRGYGKSFLMRLVQSALRARVAQGLPAVLALLPEEQHNVDEPHRLLNEIQRVLEGRPADSLLGGAFGESDGAWEKAVSELDAVIASKLPEGRGIAIAVVENFDQLMRDVFRGARDQSRLRALLDRPGGRLMLLATATRRADADYEERLFHATRMIELTPWQEETCLAFFERLREHRKAGPMSPRVQSKARALAKFIGGSPRMATVLADVLENNDSLRAAQILDALVDELTPYYKHRIESLSRRARTLMDALLRMGEPRTQSELAARLGTTQSRIAEPFNELRAAGEVVGVKAQHSAEMLYRVSDRLMAHYYRKRHLSPGEGASILETIVEFLEIFYTPEEKREEAKRFHEKGLTAHAAVFERLAMADEASLRSGQSSADQGGNWLDLLRERLNMLVYAGQHDEALALCHQAVERANASGELRELARSQRFLSIALGVLERYAEAEQAARRAFDLAGQVGDRGEQARSLRHLGWALAQLGQQAEADPTLRSAIALAEQVGDRSEQAMALRHLGWMLGQMDQYAEAGQTLRSAIKLAEQVGDHREQARSLRLLGWALGQMGQHAEADQTLRGAIEQAEQVGDRREQARSLRLLGRTLGQLGQQAKADETLRSAIELAEQVGDRREQAESLRLLGWMLGQREQYAEADLALRRSIELAEQVNDASAVAGAASELLRRARTRENDAMVLWAWQRLVAVAAAAPARSHMPNVSTWFDDVAVVALRAGEFSMFWAASAVLPVAEPVLDWAQSRLGETVADASKEHGRAVAYGLIAQAIDVLARDVETHATHDGAARIDPVAFLRGILSSLAQFLTDPALLRDIVALLEQRLPSETRGERELLEAAARRAENPDDPAALERVDPDIVTVMDSMFGTPPKPSVKPSPHQGERPGKSRRKR